LATPAATADPDFFEVTALPCLARGDEVNFELLSTM